MTAENDAAVATAAAPVIPDLPGDYKALELSLIQPNPNNIRTNGTALPGIVENLEIDGIAGLIAPLIVIPYGDGYLTVDGEQRYWSAVEAKQEYVQAIIREDLAGNVEQIISMLRQIHRTDPTANQLANGVEQLALYGLDDEEIVRRTGYDPEHVKAARAVSRLDNAVAERAQQYGLDLTQQAVLGEFTDDPDTVDKLLDEAEEGPFAFARAAEEARIVRAALQAVTERRAELAAAGVTVIHERPSSYADPGTQRLDSLRTADGKRITDDEHTTCPGHTVAVFVGEYNGRPTEVTYCTGWKAHGHTTSSASSAPVARSGPMTDEQKAERRTVIANNLAMEAANNERRKWLAQLLAGKTLPKDAEKLIAETIAGSGHLLGVWVNGGRKMLAELLSPTGKKKPGTKLVPARASKTQYAVITLAATIAAYESSITRTSWRHPDATTARFLSWCAHNGYQPGAVEKIIIDGAAPRPGRARLTVVKNTGPQPDQPPAPMSDDGGQRDADSPSVIDAPTEAVEVAEAA